MPGFSLCLLGTFRAHLNDKRAAHFETNKTRALLAYLAVEDRPHTRLQLAGLLWPDWPEAAARTYLRQALLNLRQVLEPTPTTLPYLIGNRHTIQFNRESDFWLDVATLVDTLPVLPHRMEIDGAPETAKRLEEAVALYCGDFMEGFYLDGCPAFEEWQLLTREQLRRKVVETTCFLARWHEQRSNSSSAQRYARRSLELEPLLEESHFQLMRLLANDGDSNAALTHYVRYRAQLSAELGAAPSREMTELYERIKAGRHPRAAIGRGGSAVWAPATDSVTPVSLPPFLTQPPPVPQLEPLCLARERELAFLDACLDRALSGQGNVVFVAGEAGRGKTVLLRAFAARSQSKHVRLVAVGGACSSHDGVGDALLPFHEILVQITGDLEAQWAAGAISPQHAVRLWSVFGDAVEALLAYGPDLAGTLIPGQGLAARVSFLPGGQRWRQQLETLMHARTSAPGQRALFDQLTRVLQALAGRHPLLLWIDDLHWVDRASSAMLFHLGQRLSGYPLLIAGTYRPEEVAVGRNGERHPLEKVLRELQARFGASCIDLDRAESRPFVDAYLDLEPNALDNVFRKRLHRTSDGHPLFTVELVRTMRERKGLVRDAAGWWREGPALDWDNLPSRLEAVIGERIERLPPAQRAVLEVAGVEGEEFTAEVVADVLGHDVGELIRQLSKGLDRQHYLVTAVDVQNVGGRHLSHYRFRHILFQRYIYNGLDAAERRQLHESVARSLQARTQGQPQQVAAVAGQLAKHFERADLLEQALPYACLAGDRALQMSANEEAVAYFGWGLAMLGQLPNAGQHSSLEVDLQMGLATALAMADRHTASPVQEALVRSNQLCRELNDLPRLFRGLWGLWRFCLVRGDALASLAIAQECMQIAQKMGETALVMQTCEALGCTLYRTGRMKQAQKYLAKGWQLYDADRHRSYAHLYGQDPGVSCPANEAQVLWYLGYADQARAKMEEALARAEEHQHTATIAYALIFTAGLYQRMRDAGATLRFAEQTIEYSRIHGFGQWVAVGTLYRGWALFSLGQVQQGLAQMRQGFQATLQAEMIQLRYAAILAEGLGLAGEPGEGLALVTELLEKAHRLGELEWAPEIYRVQGELLALQGGAGAEACFQRSISLARRQGSRSLELRSALSLARLCRQSEGAVEASRQLAKIVGWFTEGFDVPDLVAARVLLDEPCAAWRDQEPVLAPVTGKKAGPLTTSDRKRGMI